MDKYKNNIVTIGNPSVNGISQNKHNEAIYYHTTLFVLKDQLNKHISKFLM